MKFYIDGPNGLGSKRVSRKSVLEAVGADRLNYIERESKQALADDPQEEVEFMINWNHKTSYLVVRA
jgi:hypothetical protein